MANGRRYRHIFLEGFSESEDYRSPQRGGASFEVPRQDRRKHSARLRSYLEEIKIEGASVSKAQRKAEVVDRQGILVEFESFPGMELAFEKLARDRSGIELHNVRNRENSTYATVFVPDGKLEHFDRLIQDYWEEKKDSIGRSRDNQRLIDTIQRIRAATLQALWTDETEFPKGTSGSIWWEVWLSSGDNWEEAAQTFRRLADSQEMTVQKGNLIFPERIVLLVKASLEQMQQSMPILNRIAELRRPKETAEFFDSLTPAEEDEWLRDLLNRTRFVSNVSNVSYVCLLDTGVNRGHPLLTSALEQNDMHTVESSWGTNDSKGHGTQMAGLSLFGDMTGLLASNDPVEIEHRLESVKLIPQNGATGTDSQHHGYLTVAAVASPEIQAPERTRVFSMTITARDNRDRGQPSAWSSALDQLTSDADERGENPRLLIAAAGNIEDLEAIAKSPTSNDSDGIHDPAQAWNVITVGACTDLVRVTGENTGSCEPVADKGGLSPFSTTSLVWQKHWPLKPDVVFEGGNAAKDSLGPASTASLSLLTTHHNPAEKIFTTARATSAATALVSRMVAQIMTEYPELWPETIRALTVHSAEWTEAMKENYLPLDSKPTRKDYINLLRRCGFGKPDLERALWSVADSLTMVKQDSLHPFTRETGRAVSLNEMNLHRLPWPIEALQDLGNTEVEMRITLSYFVQPNPSTRGNSRYTYQSHGLRFDVKRPTETVDGFRRRVNLVAREESNGSSGSGEDQAWLIGKSGRHRGSIHGDIWQGTAADLAERGCIAVYPATGWWKTRQALERYNETARYALVVSIKAPEVDVDLYTEVENQILSVIEQEI